MAIQLNGLLTSPEAIGDRLGLRKSIAFTQSQGFVFDQVEAINDLGPNVVLKSLPPYHTIISTISPAAVSQLQEPEKTMANKIFQDALTFQNARNTSATLQQLDLCLCNAESAKNQLQALLRARNPAHATTESQQIEDLLHKAGNSLKTAAIIIGERFAAFGDEDRAIVAPLELDSMNTFNGKSRLELLNDFYKEILEIHQQVHPEPLHMDNAGNLTQRTKMQWWLENYWYSKAILNGTSLCITWGLPILFKTLSTMRSGFDSSGIMALGAESVKYLIAAEGTKHVVPLVISNICDGILRYQKSKDPIANIDIFRFPRDATARDLTGPSLTTFISDIQRLEAFEQLQRSSQNELAPLDRSIAAFESQIAALTALKNKLLNFHNETAAKKLEIVQEMNNNPNFKKLIQISFDPRISDDKKIPEAYRPKSKDSHNYTVEELQKPINPLKPNIPNILASAIENLIANVRQQKALNEGQVQSIVDRLVQRRGELSLPSNTPLLPSPPRPTNVLNR